jgi:hypothetical protein
MRFCAAAYRARVERLLVRCWRLLREEVEVELPVVVAAIQHPLQTAAAAAAVVAVTCSSRQHRRHRRH